MKNAFTTILFDLDETLFESSKSTKKILKSLLKKYAFDAGEDDLERYIVINSNYWGMLHAGKIDFNTLKIERFKTYLNELSVSFNAEVFAVEFLDMFKGALELIDGALPLCRQLHERGYKLYIASNGEDEIQKKRMEKAGLAPYFTGHFNSDAVGYCKPSIEYFNYIKEKIEEKDPKRILMVGDSLSTDIEGAMKAGFIGCWYCRKEAEYKNNLPCISIRSLGELRGILLP